MNKKITVDPKVIAELANLAGIRDGPYPLIVSVSGVQFSSTPRKQFEHKINASVYVAHFSVAMTNAKKNKSHKKIAELSRELVKALKASDAKHLSHFLLRQSMPTSKPLMTWRKRRKQLAVLLKPSGGEPRRQFHGGFS